MCVEDSKKCIICGSDTKVVFAGMVSCPECGHWTDHTAVADATGYCEEKVRGVCDYREVTENDKLRMGARWDMVLRYASGKKSLLDYGCADNVFIDCAPKGHGFETLVGFDTNWLTGKSDERVLDRHYDVITMWHSMEHLTFPRMVVDRVPHDYLFIIIPWIEYMTLEKLPYAWIFNTGRHINMYSRKSLFKVLPEYEILEENYEDGKFINAGEEIVGFALRRK